MAQGPVQASQNPGNARAGRTASPSRRDIGALIVTIVLTAAILGGIFAVAFPRREPPGTPDFSLRHKPSEPAGGAL
jgi:hypothetical protein